MAGSLRTKIVCTIGPASADPDTMRRMAGAGMDVARINTGHCDVTEMRDYITSLARAGEAAGKRIGVMLDLQGPRLRVGSIRGSSVELRPGQEFSITTEQKRGDEQRMSVSYAGLPEDLEPGDSVLVDDGLIRMKVKEIRGVEIVCEVVEGGELVQGKGMNFPDSTLKLPAFTDRDRRYLEAGLEAGIDLVSQSFVRHGRDVRELKDHIAGLGRSVPVIAKIEKGDAVANIDEVMDECDGIMVARGDLGVEMKTEDVPIVQKELIDKALHAAKPVVTATQMLESMISRPRPTRAEASDVANAILDGSDAVMLSAETAIGAYPVKVIEMMARIAARAEEAIDYEKLLEDRGRWAHQGTADAIGYAACKVAADLEAAAIITITRSGYTAVRVARFRPRAQILAASDDREVLDSLSVVWGVRGIDADFEDDIRRTIESVTGSCVERGLVAPGDLVVITGGFLGEKAGKTNLVHVHRAE